MLRTPIQQWVGSAVTGSGRWLRRGGYTILDTTAGALQRLSMSGGGRRLGPSTGSANDDAHPTSPTPDQAGAVQPDGPVGGAAAQLVGELEQGLASRYLTDRWNRPTGDREAVIIAGWRGHRLTVRNPDARRLDRDPRARHPRLRNPGGRAPPGAGRHPIVGHLGTSQLAGLTLAANVLGIVIGLSVFLAYGTTATVSRRLGAGDRPGALASGIDGMGLAALMGVGIAAFLILGAPWFLPWYGSSAAATGYGVTYLRIVAFGMPAQLVMLASTGVLRGLQDTRTPLRVVIAANLMNVSSTCGSCSGWAGASRGRGNRAPTVGKSRSAGYCSG